MSVLNKINGALSQAGQKAKKTYGTARLEMKLKAYAKEEAENYLMLGKRMYENFRGAVKDDELESLCENIENIRHRQRSLTKKLQGLRTGEETAHKAVPQRSPADQKAEDQAGMTEDTFAKLDKKHTDLTLTRTEDGIQILRFCPQCHSGNDPHNDECVECGHSLR